MEQHEQIDFGNNRIDLILAARMSFYSPALYRDEFNLALSQAFLGLSQKMSTEGMWAISIPRDDRDPYDNILLKEMKIDKIFEQVIAVNDSPFFDRWLILKGPKIDTIEYFIAHPQEFLTEAGGRHELLPQEEYPTFYWPAFHH